MNNEKFIEKIYGPYNDAWKIIKILQSESKTTNEILSDYMQKIDEYDAKYKDNEFAQLLKRRVLFGADDIIIKMGEDE